MNWYKLAQRNKLIIIRGISGSGKSTLSKQLIGNGFAFSTDDFFMSDGEYNYDPDLIGNAHLWNINRVKTAMQNGINPIIVDNTNVHNWEMKPYVEQALKFKYEVEFAEPNTPWKFNIDELTKRNKHGVPKEVIEKMVTEWDHDVTVEGILESEKPEE